MKAIGKLQQPRTLRQRMGLNQQQFWAAVGVTQSGGSRYESGRDMPRAVSEITPDQIEFGSGHGRWSGSLPCPCLPALSASHLFFSEYGM